MNKPVGGIDYPRTLLEFQKWFPDDAACLSYQERLRRPSGYACPKCGPVEPWRKTRGRLECPRCHFENSVTAGTIFEGTRKPLQMWFAAAWHVTQGKDGGSALSLYQTLGLGSYKTSWAWLQKLRRAMVRPNRDLLSGKVEVDESYVGGEEPGVHGRETYTKCLVAIAAEERGNGIGRIRMAVIADHKRATLTKFVKDVVAPGSEVHTDGLDGYKELAQNGYKHTVTVLSKSPDPAHVVMPRVHRVAALLKRWILSTHQGAIRPAHLPAYLDEYTFRFNRRTSKYRGMLFFRLLQQAVETDHTPYKKILKSRRPRNKAPAP